MNKLILIISVQIILLCIGCEKKSINEDFHTAITYSDKDTIQKILNKGFDVNSPGDTRIGRSALHNVRDVNIAKLLLNKGADLEQKDKEGATPICTALRFRQREIVKLLIKNGANVNVIDNSGRNLLYFAVLGGDPSSLKLLIDNGLDINAECWDKTYPIFIAIEYGNYQILKCLIENGADCFVKEKSFLPEGVYPITKTLAYRNNNPEIFKKMIELLLNNMDMNQKLDNEYTYIHYAIKCDYYFEQDYIYAIAKQSDINSTDWSGSSVLDSMELYKNKSDKHRKFYEYLLVNGAKSYKKKNDWEHDFSGGEINENEITEEQATQLATQIVTNKYSPYDTVSNITVIYWCDLLIKNFNNKQSIMLLDYLFTRDNKELHNYYFSSYSLILSAAVDNEEIFDHLIKLGVSPDKKTLHGEDFFEAAEKRFDQALIDKYFKKLGK